MPKTKSDNRAVEIKMDDKVNIQTIVIISGINLKSLCTASNEYGTGQLFQILDERQLGYICELAE